MIRGGCLCGTVRFEVDEAIGPFELCHCTRCRKTSGSAFVAGIEVRGLRITTGREEINTFEMPVVQFPPGYTTHFCARCGSPTPPPDPPDELEIAAGTLDDDPGISPDKHIFVEFVAPWHEITDALPQLDMPRLIALRIEAMKRKRAEGKDKDKDKNS